MENSNLTSYDPVANNLLIHSLNSKGSWLGLRLPCENQSGIEAIQHVVQELLTKEGITEWKPYGMERMHISLFRGFTPKLSEEKLKHVLRTLGLYIAKNRVLSHAIKINVSDSTTTIVRGPGPYVTLHFRAEYLKIINRIVKDELIKLMREGVFTKDEICDESKLFEELSPHLTLGAVATPDALERDPNKQNPQIKRLNNAQSCAAFYERFKNAQKNECNAIRFSLPIENLELLGLSESNDSIAKIYPTLATIDLRRVEPKDPPSHLERAFKIHLEGETRPVEGTANLRTTFKTKLLLNAYTHNSSQGGLMHSGINQQTLSIDVSVENYHKKYDQFTQVNKVENSSLSPSSIGIS